MRPPRRRRARSAATVVALWLLAAGAGASAGVTAEHEAGEGFASASAHDDEAGTGGEEGVHLKLLATNDIHARLRPPTADHGGAAELAAHLARIRAQHPSTLHVDTGDAAGGFGGLSSRLHHEPTIEALDAMGLDVQALGNHEFDAGLDELRRRHEGGCRGDDCGYRGDAPFTGASWEALAGNVIDRETGEPIFPATTTLELEGVRVGFIGVTATNVGELLDHDELDTLPWDETINAAAAELEEDGADVIVVLRHLGSHPADDNDPDDCEGWRVDEGGESIGRAARFVQGLADPPIHPAVDVVVDGHTHRAYVCDFEDRPHWPLTTQAYQHTLMFTEIDLHVDPDTGEVVDREATNHWVDHTVEPDPDVLDVIEHATAWISGTLEGAVTDADTGTPIAGATVSVGGRATSTTTGSDGSYGLEVFAGDYLVAVEADGYETAYAGAEIRVQRTTTLDVELSEPAPEHDGGPACPADQVPDAGFTDVTAYRDAVNCLAAWGVTEGVGDGTRFDPGGTVTRGQMASFLARAIRSSGGSLPAGGAAFPDVAGTHAEAIDQLAAAGIAGGYPDGTYRPNAPVTRGQMATFLARSFEHRTGVELPPASSSGLTDVRGSTHEARIDQAVAQGWAQGYEDATYRPGASVRRDHMALFLTRWLDTLTREWGVEFPG